MWRSTLLQGIWPKIDVRNNLSPFESYNIYYPLTSCFTGKLEFSKSGQDSGETAQRSPKRQPNYKTKTPVLPGRKKAQRPHSYVTSEEMHVSVCETHETWEEVKLLSYECNRVPSITFYLGSLSLKFCSPAKISDRQGQWKECWETFYFPKTGSFNKPKIQKVLHHCSWITLCIQCKYKGTFNMKK